jgi:hypothetical protein
LISLTVIVFFPRDTTMIRPPRSTDVLHLWIYCISGVGFVLFLMIMVCYFACRQECSERASRRKAKAVQSVALEQWQQQVNSFPDLASRPASDILVELGLG